MNKFFIYIIILMCGVQSIAGQSDSIKGKVFVTPNFKGEGIAIKWISSNVYFQEGCNVYRREVEGDWSKINTSPVKMMQSLTTDIKLDEGVNGLYEYARDTDYKTFQDDFMRAFVVITAIIEPQLAEAIGITYYDVTAVKNKEYQYKVVGISGSTKSELNLSKTIKYKGYVKPEKPSDFQLNRVKGQVNLTWAQDSDEFYGVNIYRKAQEEESFSLLTKQPFAVQKIENNKGERIYPEVFYKDSVKDEIEYSYKIEAIDYFGQKSEYTKELKAVIPDLVPPMNPIDFKSETRSKDMEVDLLWEYSDEDFDGFNIYRTRSLSDDFEKINNSLIAKLDRNYTDKLDASGGFYYMLSAIDKAGNESYSGVLMADVKDFKAPDAPRNFESKADSGKISLSWSPNTEGDLAGYFIQKSLFDDNNQDNYYSNVNTKPIIDNFYQEELAKNIRNKFVYRVIAIDTNYNKSVPSMNSLAQMPDVEAPRVPVISKVEKIDGKVDIHWLSNVEEDLKGYNLYRRIAGDTANFKQVNINVIRNPITSYTDRSAMEGITYEYKVAAIDESANQSQLSVLYTFKVKKELGEAKIDITSSKVVKNKKQVQLTWDNGNANHTMRGYVVYKSDHTGVLKPFQGLSLSQELKDKIKPNEIVKYQIRGFTEDGAVVLSEIIEHQLIIE